jgi:DNA-binding LytR/AlgR family response regulator
MKKIKCLIVDDEPLALDLIERYVQQTPFLELAGRCANAFEAMQALEQSDIELLFLDIQMPDLNGVAFSRTLRPAVKVIFTTAFEQYALEGFRVDALDYLLKPFDYEEFIKAANKARAWFQREEVFKTGGKNEPDLFVKSEYQLIRIHLDDVLYAESMKNHIKIHVSTQDKPVVTLMSLKNLENALPTERFMRVHRSFIVNLNKIDSIERNRILIRNQAIIIAEPYRETFQHYLTSKLLNS